MQARLFRPVSAAFVVAVAAAGVLVAAPLPGAAADAPRAKPASGEPRVHRVVVIGKRMTPGEQRAYDAGVADGRRMARAEAAGEAGEDGVDRAPPAAAAPSSRSAVEPRSGQRLASRARDDGAGRRVF